MNLLSFVKNPSASRKATGTFCFLFLSQLSYSQSDSTRPAPKPFLFSKYQLPAQSGSAAPSFYSLTMTPAKYKIHYKIKMLSFPSEPEPERPSLIGAIINGIIESKDDETRNNSFLIPYKKQ